MSRAQSPKRRRSGTPGHSPPWRAGTPLDTIMERDELDRRRAASPPRRIGTPIARMGMGMDVDIPDQGFGTPSPRGPSPNRGASPSPNRSPIPSRSPSRSPNRTRTPTPTPPIPIPGSIPGPTGAGGTGPYARALPPSEGVLAWFDTLHSCAATVTARKMVQVVENQYARAMEGVAFWGRRVHEVERRRGVGASGSGSGSGSGGLSAGGGVAGSPGGTASGGGISGDRIWTSLTTGMQYFSAAERERDFSSSVATAAADTHVLERYAAYSAYAIALRECVAAARTVEAQAQQIWDEAARRAAMFPELVAEGV